MHTLPNPQNPKQHTETDLAAPALDATQALGSPQPAPASSSLSTPYAIPLRRCLHALTACWIVGGLLRILAVSYANSDLSHASSIVLFAPLPAITLWLAWRTQLRTPEIATAVLLAFAAFAVWNGVMLFELRTPALAYALQQNALHWTAYAILAIGAGKCWQWLTGVGIWRRSFNDSSCAEPAANHFSLRHLLLITMVIALTVVGYQTWIRSVLTSQPSIAIMQSDLDQILTPDPPTWYQWFPANARLWVSGAVGGFLLPLHAFVLASILRMRQRRGIAIVAWIIAAIAIRLLTDQIYWHSDRLNLERADITWIQISYDNPVAGPIGIPRRYATYIEPFNDLVREDSATTSNPAQWSIKNVFEAGGLTAELPSKALDACIQTAVLAASLIWLARFGFRIGTRSIREHSDPRGLLRKEPVTPGPIERANSL